MPHKYYHGKTGRIWNVTKRALGVVVRQPALWVSIFYLIARALAILLCVGSFLIYVFVYPCTAIVGWFVWCR